MTVTLYECLRSIDRVLTQKLKATLLRLPQGLGGRCLFYFRYIMKTTGYFKEYYIGNTYIGKKECQKDREMIGFRGFQNHTAESDIKFKNKKIKAGQSYRTMIYPLNGEKA